MSYNPGVKRRRLLLGVIVIAVASLEGGWLLLRRQPLPPSLIFEGITYGCDLLDPDSEGSGLVHWVRVDLGSPGIALYVTPLDPDAVGQGWQFRLRKTASVVADAKLAVAVNGTLFTAKSGWLPMSGDLARAVETTVADHQVSHVWKETYLLWFDDELTPRIETTKPPSDSVLKRTWWGIGGQGVGLKSGKIWDGIERGPVDSRTAVGIDSDRKLLFLAVFQSASPRRTYNVLRELGARDGMLLDGGDSTSMAIGRGARGIRPGLLTGGWRPVATHFGVRAKRLNENRPVGNSQRVDRD